MLIRKVGHQPFILAHVSQKLHEKEEIWSLRGAHIPGAPPGSTNADKRNH